MNYLNQVSFHSMLKIALLAVAFCSLTSGCSRQPVLYPNDQLLEAGRQQADADIRECMEMAEAHGVKPQQGEKVAKSTAVGTVGGAGGGAVAGAIAGNLGTGVAAGAASGAAVGLLYGLFQVAEPGATYKNFVDKCLIKKGYEPVGWE